VRHAAIHSFATAVAMTSFHAGKIFDCCCFWSASLENQSDKWIELTHIFNICMLGSLSLGRQMEVFITRHDEFAIYFDLQHLEHPTRWCKHQLWAMNEHAASFQ
jgi:hypothetical protein